MTPGKAYLSPESIRRLAARSDLMGVWLLVHCWGVIFGSVAVFALWPNILTFLLAVVLIGSRQLGLAILMHEAAHNALFKTRALNEFAGEWLCGRPILAELASYRHYHLTHHRFTQSDKDPDLTLSEKFPTSRASLQRKFIRDLTGQTGIKQLSAQIMMSFRLAGDDDAIEAATQDAAQAFKARDLWKSLPVFFGVGLMMSLLGNWWYGLAFWLLPYLTWFQLVLRIRNIAEHGATEKSDDPLQNVRTTLAGPVARALVAPYWVNYHLEHHMVMHVPCWRLPALHRALTATGLKNKMKISPTYGHALSEAGW
ncbi:fatty acid desaturase family protein [Sulfitobacter sp. TSTF-M16]|uniref:Fatty acid desaturase family protein n=2 Tax=Sulfitobacter aestuariivivens TaxID=2766981 RepID=A0A927D7K8_9RHOB|nr:fatty acid desaturase family protein [Sulfitobacter aestuariivivens]MBD3664692.1 fatty acid desaturase family protein [Sulfitobacter aestuariivivens]